jgi:hypothetical protein
MQQNGPEQRTGFDVEHAEECSCEAGENDTGNLATFL